MEYYHGKILRLELSYLYESDKNKYKEMTTEQVKKVLYNFKRQKGIKVLLTGGEPLDREDIFEILDYMEEIELLFQFETNSINIDKEILERLSGYRYLELYATSITSNSNNIRSEKGRKKLNSVLKAIEYFEYTHIKNYIKVNLVDGYLYDMDHIADMFATYNDTRIRFTPISTMRIDDIKDIDKKFILPKEEYSLFNYKLEELKNQYPDVIENSTLWSYERIFAHIRENMDKELYARVDGFMAVRPNGDLSLLEDKCDSFVFGKGYESMRIPRDNKLYQYMDTLRKAEMEALAASRTQSIELGAFVKEYFKQIDKENKSKK